MTASHMLPQSWVGWCVLGIGALLLAVLPFYVPAYYVGLTTIAMIAAMLALSVHLLIGGAGLVSLCHGAFYGVGAYTVFFLSPEGAPQPAWFTLPAAMLASGLCALVVGALSIRTKGFFFLMVTLAFGQMLFTVLHDTKLGGGTDGAYLAKPILSLFGFTFDPMSLPRSQRSFPAYYVALAQLIVTYLALAFLLRSLFGRVLHGIKLNEHRMEALGYNTRFYKLCAFVIAGVFAGAAGHMWSLQSGFVNPELLAWQKSAEALLMILLGGINSLAGAIVGAFAFTALGEVAQSLTDRKLLVEGLVVLLAVIVLRNGIAGIRFRDPRRLLQSFSRLSAWPSLSPRKPVREARQND
ncbi:MULTISPECIES: branched-chain amino acid ABC transporter permease [unclassified Beijerinckia]|uniref:branched-chain amino acid ABC transporter permease n=1 Tax=unclassified Beijerinckia TaxID=2638183 RepID=UPI00089BABE8|nr:MULTISPECIES: branched-chain amino acid ABC transporter permease [unclassified Beijerinckia]MDH7798634.1 branched-chain amino acid transport system permease protein [Beijerinckia sp. GAS462]SED27432.1 amino acid/amide ABC transporter membrane protein 2, HAAT family [Beijerinckia sp. 28-YEA-48]